MDLTCPATYISYEILKKLQNSKSQLFFFNFNWFYNDADHGYNQAVLLWKVYRLQDQEECEELRVLAYRLNPTNTD